MNSASKESGEFDSLSSKKQFQNNSFLERMDLLYKNLIISVPASFVCATITFLALYRVPHTQLLKYWYIAGILLSILRLGQTWLYARDHRCTKFGFYIFVLMTALSAAIWGMAGSFLMPDQYYVEQMIVIVVMSGVAAGGVQSLHPSMIACCVFNILLILPLACWAFLQNEIPYSVLGITVIIYLLYNLVISLRGHRFLQDTLKLKYENIALAENVSTTNKQLVQINQEIQEKENNLRLIHDNAPIGMAIVSLEGKWINVNNKLCEIVDYNKEELEKLTIQDITYHDDIESDLENRSRLLSGKIQAYEMEKRYIKKNNELTWIVTNVSLVRGKGDRPLYYVSQIQDINDRKQNEKIISLLSNMNSMLQLCHDSSEAYNIISQTASKIFPDLTGGLAVFNKEINRHDTVKTWGDQVSLKPSFRSEDCWAFRSGTSYVASGAEKDVMCHHFDQIPSSTYICIPLIVQSQVLGLLSFTGISSSYQQQLINNFSESIKLSLSNIQLKEKLSEQALKDPLTGLFNRRYFYDTFPNLLQQAILMKQQLTVAMIDIDFFKTINDVYGHDAGDEVLKQFGTLLKNKFTDENIVCRLGGEEFILILVGTDLKEAETKMEQLKFEIANIRINFQNVILPPTTVSIGIAEAPQHGKAVNDILRAADIALYAAKESGRNRLVVYGSVPAKI